MFYFRDLKEERRLEPILYAYTNDIDYAKRFEEVRDMKKFQRVDREISKDEFKDFVHQYSYQKLTKTAFITKDKEFPTKETKVEMICTWEEENSVIIQSDESVFQFFKDMMFNPFLLSKKLNKVLFTLGFFTIYQYLYQNMYIFEPLKKDYYRGVFRDDNADMASGDFDKESVVSQMVKADQLEMFLYLYGGTIKK